MTTRSDLQSLRHFPADAIILGVAGLGYLSWTAEVGLFRLGILPAYEHSIAFALLGLVLMAAKGSSRLSLLEFVTVILIAASLEAFKAEIPYRHPKLSDFYSDIVGLTISAALAAMIRISSRLALISVRIVTGWFH